ncbi:hypothetical protein BWI96_18295 [Siphonobacter sp. SORGH_AS_0500]|uniref:DUF5777 family beta-barrel protein n=1 Tax=Siphonobacter sp. SORGH_AS_0500 TaxID=1864824 RepID=UPI000CB7B3B7|nr:DUF5777 family beta-barrel protein [Siphonobacter sp. SORGH_AS_0500]PKK35163.1 hypothetical protein BWI96_18295 [Siphonobacter sp. SORGH_AS_0500]
MKHSLFFFLLSGLSLCGQKSFAQDDDLLKSLDQPAVKTYTSATFKGTRLMNGHTVETVKRKHLDFLISHRFGRLNSGIDNFYGLDEAYIRLGLDYGVTDRLTVGVGRSSIQKTVDLYAKYRLLRQSTGEHSSPVSITLFASDAIITEPTRENATSTLYYNNGERQNWTFQALIARKFNDKFSLQLMPTFVTLGKADTETEAVTALGIGGRYKISKRVSVNAEYYARFLSSDQKNIAPGGANTYNAFAVGVDIETGGHVFQLHFTNAQGMIEKQFLTQTTGNFFKGDIHYGFNISRTFSFDRKR